MRSWWLVLPVVVVSGGLVTVAAMSAAADPASNATLVITVIGAVSIVAVLITWFEARRFGRRLGSTIDALSATQADLRRLLDDLPDAVVGLDEDGRINSANGKAATLTGRSVEDLIGRGFLSMVGEADRASVSDTWQRVDLGRRVAATQDGSRRAGDLAGQVARVILPVTSRCSNWSMPTATRTWWRRRCMCPKVVAAAWCCSGTSPIASGRRPRSNRLAAVSSRRFTRRRPGWLWSDLMMTASSMPISRWPRCSVVHWPRCWVRRCGGSPTPKTLAPQRASAPNSNSASPIPMRSSSVICASRRHVRVGAHSGVGVRGRRGGIGDHPHRRRHRTAPACRAAHVCRDA